MNIQHQKINSAKFNIDYTKFKTTTSKRRRPSATRELTKISYSMPNSVISLAEGMPNEETFPITEIKIKLTGGANFVLEGDELGAALQYIPSQGYPPLLQTMREYQKRAHNPPTWDNRDIIVVSGSQDGLSKALEAIIAPGDPILVQDPVYPGVTIVLAPHQAEIIPVPQDKLGLVPDKLRKILEKRDIEGKKMPKLLYINATGANPSGSLMPIDRRRQIYQIACDYDFLILDDDPYHFLYFTQEEPTSFLTLDTEGRVIRLDSFSKVLSSGLRIGLVTAAAPLISSMELHIQSSHLHATTLSQVILYKCFKIWGYNGMMEHYRFIRSFYKEKRDKMSEIADKYLKDLADFEKPEAGMFLWIKIRGIKDTWNMLMKRGIKHGILMTPGAAFLIDSSMPSNAIRASFSRISYEEMELAIKRLAKLIQDELSYENLLAIDNT